MYLELITLPSFLLICFIFYEQLSQLSYLKLAFFLFNFISIQYLALLYLHVLSVVFTLGAMHLYVLTVKLRQLEQAFLIKQKTSVYYTFFTRRFHFHYVSVLSLFAVYNRLYGMIFILFLVFNCPVNAHIIVSLLYSVISPASAAAADWPAIPLGRFHLISYLTFQLMMLFRLHFHLATFSSILLRPIWQLHRLVMSRQTRRLRLKLKMCLLLLLQQMLVKENTRKVGVTYGPFGQVTMRSFAMAGFYFIFFCLKSIILFLKQITFFICSFSYFRENF